MIVEITSLTPRATLSQAAIPAHAAPTNIAVRIVRVIEITFGSCKLLATTAAASEPKIYCPLTPMLKRFILNPIETANALKK